MKTIIVFWHTKYVYTLTFRQLDCDFSSEALLFTLLLSELRFPFQVRVFRSKSGSGPTSFELMFINIPLILPRSEKGQGL